MPDNCVRTRQMCKNCKVRHVPPTGKKCQRKKQEGSVNEHLQEAAIAGSTHASQSTSGAQEDGQLLQLKILQQLQKVTERLDQVEDLMSATDRHSYRKY